MLVNFSSTEQNKQKQSSGGVLCKKDVLRNFPKLTGKHLCQSLFFNEIAGLRPVNLLKKRLRHRCFPVNIAKFLRKPFFLRTPLVAASVVTNNVKAYLFCMGWKFWEEMNKISLLFKGTFSCTWRESCLSTYKSSSRLSTSKHF